jgi:hypothetical protein
MRAINGDKDSMDVRRAEAAGENQIKLPLGYTWTTAEFTYSLRCALCRTECEHTLTQHNILSGRL